MTSADWPSRSSIGRYEILRRLGVGGMAEVYLAQDHRLRRQVAIKVLGERLVHRPGYRAYLQREARAVARLNHPHIAQVYDVLEHDGRTCFVMEYVEGETLMDRLRRGPLRLAEAARLGAEVAGALAHAHAQHVLHCDLKPSNVFLTRSGSVKVLDFGLARLAGDDPLDSGEGLGASPTLVLNRAGTPAYMSPEQLLGQPLDARSDLFALGIMLSEMVTGRRPARFPVGADALSADPTRELTLVDADAPAALRPILERTLAPRPSDRYASAVEMQAALEVLATRSEPGADPLPLPRRDHGEPGEPSFELDVREAVKHAGTRRHALTGLIGRAALSGVALVSGITLLGLLNSAAFNLTLARGAFADEGLADWLRWGSKSIVAPGALAGVLVVVGELVRPVVRYIYRRWLRRMAAPLASSLGDSALRNPSAGARLIAIAGIAAIAVVCWRFQPLLAAFVTLNDISTGDLSGFAILGDDHLLMHRHYRMALTVIVVVLTVGLYHAVRGHTMQHGSADRSSLAAAAAVLGLALILLNHPYRLFYQAFSFERVEVGTASCYILGERSADLLVFCPARPVPRNRAMPRESPELRRLGCFGKIFGPPTQCAPAE